MSVAITLHCFSYIMPLKYWWSDYWEQKAGWLLQPFWEGLLLERKLYFLRKEDPTLSLPAGLTGVLVLPLPIITIPHQFGASLWSGVPQTIPDSASWRLRLILEELRASQHQFSQPAPFPQSLLPWTLAPPKAKNALLQGFFLAALAEGNPGLSADFHALSDLQHQKHLNSSNRFIFVPFKGLLKLYL